MAEMINLYVHGCLICQMEKSNSRYVREPLQSMVASYPNMRVNLDFAGPFTETHPHGYKFILIMSDAFSNFVAAVPTKDTSAAATLDAFLKQWVTVFGIPDSIHSDRGTNFESKLMSMVCAQFGIKQTRTTAFHPQSNGQAEKAVGDIKKNT